MRTEEEEKYMMGDDEQSENIFEFKESKILLDDKKENPFNIRKDTDVPEEENM